MSITITLQAASDAIMTDDNKLTGTVLADDDLRKVYGLPNMYISSDELIQFATYSSSSAFAVKPPRWDSVNTPSATINSIKTVTISAQEYAYGMPDEYELYYDWVNTLPDIVRYAAHKPPTTTAFQLRCDSISHDVDDASAISPLPSMNTNNGAKANSMTPGQLINIVIGMGLRSEVIKLTGVLVDEGLISASNPRKQVLMNIARLQYLKSGRSGSENSWGGSNGGPLNPRSYPCLTIYDSNSVITNTFDRMDPQPAGLDLSYRGIIKNLTFRQEGGRPNQWFWSMEFQVVANEHAQGSMLSSADPAGAMQISRIRLVNLVDGETALTTGPPSDYPSLGYIEVQVVNSLTQQTGPNTFTQVANNQAIKISSSNSVPPINGNWTIHNVNTDNRTFLLHQDPAVGNPGDIEWISDEDSAGRDISIATGPRGGGEPRGRSGGTAYLWEGFTNGTDGYAIFPPTVYADDDSGKVVSGMRTVDLTLPESMVSPEAFNE